MRSLHPRSSAKNIGGGETLPPVLVKSGRPPKGTSSGYARILAPPSTALTISLGTGDEGPETRDRGRGTRDQRPGTGDQGPETRDRRPGTRDRRPGTKQSFGREPRLVRSCASPTACISSKWTRRNPPSLLSVCVSASRTWQRPVREPRPNRLRRRTKLKLPTSAEVSQRLQVGRSLSLKAVIAEKREPVPVKKLTT
jgi:hypothetical protein